MVGLRFSDAMPMKRYCLGFVFSPDFRQVLLIEKRRPKWQEGLLNGIGGKLEGSETAVEAMVRECREETCLEVPEGAWEPAGTITDGITHEVQVFRAFYPLEQATSPTDEPLRTMLVAQVTEHPLVPETDRILASLMADFPPSA